MFRKNKNNKSSESYKYVVNHLRDIVDTQNNKVFAFTSSLPVDFYFKTIYEIFSQFNKDDIRTLLIDIDSDNNYMVDSEYKIIKLGDINKGLFEQTIDSNREAFDVILVALPPVTSKANALECAKYCKNVVLIEKYMYSKYEDYENLLVCLKSYNIKVHGVITLK